MGENLCDTHGLHTTFTRDIIIVLVNAVSVTHEKYAAKFIF